MVHIFLSKDGDTVYHSFSGNHRFVTATSFSTTASPIRADAPPGEYDVEGRFYLPASQVAGSPPASWVELKPLRKGFTILAP
jgi:hypothetical protein